MVEFLICLFLSCMISFGMTIALVEKSDTWPLKRIRIIIQKCIHDKISWRAAQVLFCSTCSIFYITLISDVCIGIFSFIFFGVPYFFWPLSGFIMVGFTWVIISLINALDREKNVNIFIDKNDNVDIEE